MTTYIFSFKFQNIFRSISIYENQISDKNLVIITYNL